MTTIAFDGKALAVDSQSTEGSMRTYAMKAKRAKNGAVLAVCGDLAGGYALMAWYEQGADRDKWPASQGGEGYAHLIVILNGVALQYVQSAPFGLECQAPFMAWGSGRDFALGALEMGASAERAVKIACKYDTSSGGKVRVFKCGPKEVA